MYYRESSLDQVHALFDDDNFLLWLLESDFRYVLRLQVYFLNNFSIQFEFPVSN